MCVESGTIDKDFRNRGPFRIAVDFDGVIHRYSRGWADGSIYDPPADHCKEVLDLWTEMGYSIVVHSVRTCDRTQFGETTKGQYEEMKEWLARYNIPYTSIWQGQGKPFAHLYLDDNAVRHMDWSNSRFLVGRLFDAWEKAHTERAGNQESGSAAS